MFLPATGVNLAYKRAQWTDARRGLSTMLARQVPEWRDSRALLGHKRSSGAFDLLEFPSEPKSGRTRESLPPCVSLATIASRRAGTLRRRRFVYDLRHNN